MPKEVMNSACRSMCREARALKENGVLYDPTNDEILLAACECAGLDPRILEKISSMEKYYIIHYYEAERKL